MYNGMPLKVSYGLGVDSTAMLIEMARRSIEVDLILFADTGGEKQETYEYLPIINRFLRSVGYSEVIVLRKRGMDASLYDECLRKGCLPSISYGRKSCSLKWKVQPQEYYCNNSWPLAKETWDAGRKVLSAIGLDGGKRDKCRSTYAGSNAKPNKKYDYWYPLQEWGIDRTECVAIIENASLPVPVKSSCFFCGSMRLPEILSLTPELQEKAVALEDKALPSLRTVKGLGRRLNWRGFLEEQELVTK